MYSVKMISDLLLSFAPMSHKKLQKMLYYAQAYYLAHYKRPLVDTDFEAWVHGPVSPRLYSLYKNCGFKNIPQTSSEPYNKEHSDYVFIERIYERFGHMSADELEELSHSESPWNNARKGCLKHANCNKTISEQDMINCYKDKCDFLN